MNRVSKKLLACVLVAVGAVAAQDVIVKEGTIGTGSVSPDSRVKVFISDGPNDVTVDYGLLTVTTDAINGTDSRYGTACEFFPDASGIIETSKVGGAFFTYPVGTEAKGGIIYWGVFGAAQGMKHAYTIDNKTVGLYGVGYSVSNENDVAGGTTLARTYTTCAAKLDSKPVDIGYEMTGKLNFKNYGLDVSARLVGDYQATSGPTQNHYGENYGIKITTTDDLNNAATRPIYSYALWLQAFASDANLGPGGETWGLYQYGEDVNNCFEGNLEVRGLFDHTPGYSGTAQDALNEILNTKSINGKIDHSSLPVMARATLKRVDKTNVRMVEQTDPSGKIVEVEEYDTRVVEEEGRSLGGMITVLTEAVKGLNEKLEALAAENQVLKAEIAALKATATTP